MAGAYQIQELRERLANVRDISEFKELLKEYSVDLAIAVSRKLKSKIETRVWLDRNVIKFVIDKYIDTITTDIDKVVEDITKALEIQLKDIAKTLKIKYEELIEKANGIVFEVFSDIDNSTKYLQTRVVFKIYSPVRYNDINIIKLLRRAFKYDVYVKFMSNCVDVDYNLFRYLKEIRVLEEIYRYKIDVKTICKYTVAACRLSIIDFMKQFRNMIYDVRIYEASKLDTFKLNIL